MSDAPVFNIDLKVFREDPYPDLARMRRELPVAFVPELGATLLTRRDDIFEKEKLVEVFSSEQPGGLMTRLMGHNMMRKDGEAHMAERRAVFPAVSPKTVKVVWKEAFEELTTVILDDVAQQGSADMVRDIATRISAEALKAITGLTNMSWREMDRVSQGMMDGIANYTGVPEVEANCNDCTTAIDLYIDEMVPDLEATPNQSILSVMLQAGLSKAQIRANTKLAISGGQNEPRDVIAGLTWALLTHIDQLQMVLDGRARWMDAFEEYVRWMSPIGMSPREVVQKHELHGVTLKKGDRVFLMYGAGNRDESVFARPDVFDITRNTGKSIAFGAGPHFCAGAFAARCLIAEVAMPMLFDRLSGLRLTGETVIEGWAFRGPTRMPVAWNQS